MVGQDLLNLLNDNLGGYQNAVAEEVKLRRLNEGKDELWKLLRETNKDFFVISSQSTTPATTTTYFGPLATNTREYTLPSLFRSIRLIEVTTSGYEQVEFIGRKLVDSDFQEARRASTVAGAGSGNIKDVYHYAIIGTNTFMLAEYPEVALTLRIWFVAAIPDFELDTDVDDIIEPYVKKISEYAAKRILKSVADSAVAADWEREWKDSVMSMVATAGDLQPDIRFVEDFEG